jgi:transcriptional regulator with XRE-family HTH domain
MPKPSNPIDRHVGSRVRQQRIRLGLSQQELAETLGITLELLQEYENGDERIGARHLQVISQNLLASPAYFFDENSHGRPKTADGSGRILPESAGDFVDPGEGLKLYRAFAAIKDARMRELIISLVVLIARTETAVRCVRQDLPESTEV